MATLSDARAVKSLNTGPGRKRFTFKTVAKQIEEIDIDVFHDFDPMVTEPKEGSTFFRDCLIEWRELNTAEDFISFYQEVFPLVQTLPQIVLQKDVILSKLLSRLEMKSRLSVEPILRLIAALSRDLLEDFPPYLQRVVNSLVCLLKSGADREPEMIKQIFTSWSYVMMFLQKYLIKDIVDVLKATATLRYYPHDDIQRFMAKSVSFLLRSALNSGLIEQVKKGTRKIVLEVLKKPSDARKYGATELFLHVIKRSSSTLHSKAQQVLQILLDKSLLSTGDQVMEGSESVVDVLLSTFGTLSNDLGPKDLCTLWRCIHSEIIKSKNRGHLVHLHLLLSLLVCTLENGYMKKVTDYNPTFELFRELLLAYVTPCSEEGLEPSKEMINILFQLALVILDGLQNDLPTLSEFSRLCDPLFRTRNTSLLVFLRDLVGRDPNILRVFRINIISALNDLVEISEDETVYLLLKLIDNLQMPSSSFLDGLPKTRLSKICGFVQGTIRNALGHGFSSMSYDENRLALLWGAIQCYPYIFMGLENLPLLLDFINTIDELLMADSGFCQKNYQSLIGATLSSCKELIGIKGVGDEEPAISKFIYLAKKHRSSSQILGPIADILDSHFGSVLQVGSSNRKYHPEFQASMTSDALATYAENICHFDPLLRESTLRILCHYEPLTCESSTKGHSEDKTDGDVASHNYNVDNQVLEHLLSVETIDLSSTSRKGELLLSRIQMSISSKRINEKYVPTLLYGMIAVFHKQFSKFWDPAMECLSLLISQHHPLVWERYVKYLGHCESMFLRSHDDSGDHASDAEKQSSDLIGSFKSSVSSQSGTTSYAKVFSLLIKALHKVPSLAESGSKQLMPLFFKFMGCHINDSMSLELCDLQYSKQKEWKDALKEWLNLFRLVRNPKLLYQSQLLRDVLEYRLLDDTDAEVQLKVLDCLLNWKDEFLVPYGQHLKDLIISKNLREELTTWSISRESNQIDAIHRNHVVPIILRILVPKVKKIKSLASRKHASVQQRRAILGFLAELDIDELPLFFALLINPLRTTSGGAAMTHKYVWFSSERTRDGLCSTLKEFTVDSVKALSLKKRFGFLHVVEEVLAVFDEFRIDPFLDLLMGLVVRILASCLIPVSSKSEVSSPTDSGFDLSAAQDEATMKNNIKANTAEKQAKELRPLCLKIISSALGKYENHDFSSDLWDHFFEAMKPLIANFRLEGATSEKPSALFSCFLAMSRSFKFVPILSREENIVPDIFAMLKIKTSSDAIISGVFKFVENLLNLDLELGTKENSAKKVLLPHLKELIESLHSLFNRKKRELAENELRVFKLLSCYIKEPLEAKMFVDILIPLLSNRSWTSDSYVELLQMIRHVIEVAGSENSVRILSAVHPLLSFADLEVRKSICDVLIAVANFDSSVLVVAKLLTELNATSAIEIDSLDYDSIIAAYEKINREFFCAVPREQAMLVLCHTVYDMSSPELILRQSAYRLLLCFIEFAAEILEGKSKSDHGWTEALIRNFIRNDLLKRMGKAMDSESSVQKVWIDLLREMVLKLPSVANFGSCGILYSQDPEQDFFCNIIHLQKHRRAKALSRFSQANSSGNLSKDITTKVFRPLFFNLLFGVQEGKGENVRSACFEAIACISACMSWNEYKELLDSCFRGLTAKREKRKILLRLISSILDQFPFSETCMDKGTCATAKEIEVAETSITVPSTSELRKSTASVAFADIQAYLQKTMLPKIQKLLTSDSDNVNVTVSLVALKVLKWLPREIMEMQLSSILHRISNFLTNRLDSVRDEARAALAACLKELGLEYLQFMVKILKSTLKRGFEMHVLGYTLHFLLSKFIANPMNGKFDHCLLDLLSIIENDILGDVSDQKEVEKLASKMKETRKQKSFETLQLIAQNITFRTHAVKLLSVVTTHLQKPLTPKLKLKMENILNHIASGIDNNSSVDQTELFIFVHRLIKDTVDNVNHELKKTLISKDVGDSQMMDSDRLINVEARHSHLITVFALRLLQNHIKGMKLNRRDEKQLSMLDPFISLLSDCLSSKYENIVSSSLKCLSPLVRLPLPALGIHADKIKISLLFIAQGSPNAGSPLMESCLRLLIVLLRSTSVTLSTDQLQMLIQFPLFIDIERNPTFVCLSLLKAIVDRKLVVPEIYTVVKQVSQLMVTAQSEPIRKKCSQILLQFLLDYHLSDKLLQQYLNSFLANLRYEHPSGRESVLEMIHTIIVKFPSTVLDEKSQKIFFHLVLSLANDPDHKVRSMSGAAIKLLVARVSSQSLNSILEYSLSWYMGNTQHLWSAAAQVLGLLVEVINQGFYKYANDVFPVMKRILRASLDSLIGRQVDGADDSAISFWREAYYTLVLLEKILNKFQKLSSEKDLEDIWGMICEFLVHPHLWLQNISNRLIAFFFAKITEADRETFLLMRPSRLFFISASLCCQLRTQLTDDAAKILIHNLDFAMCNLHSVLQQSGNVEFPKFWSSLEETEQSCLVRAFHVLDPSKGKGTLAYLTSDIVEPHGEEYNKHSECFLVSYLLKRMGRISLQLDTEQTKVVFNCFKAVSARLLRQPSSTTPTVEANIQDYACQMLLPLYKVCEGYAGIVVSDDLKQLAQEVCDSIRDNMGTQNFVQVYSEIRKNLKAKRDKRKQEVKVMAVVNPMRNAKRKLKVSAKHRAYKKRKMMTMKMGKWV